MRRVSEHWTTQELELYHDEELDPTQTEELSEALRHDPALRNRLAAVYRTDDALRTALTDEGSRHERRPVRSRRFSFARLAAASVFIGVIPAVVWYALSHSSPRSTRLTADTRAERQPTAVATEYEPIRVVLSLPVRQVWHGATEPRRVTLHKGTRSETSSDFENRTFLAQLDRTLRAGRVQDTVLLLESTTEDQRSVAYRHISDLLRSALVAEQILDHLSPSEQLAVCGEWVREPRLRPVAFTRLRRLSGEPSLSDALQLLTSRLAHEPDLRIWLRSYQLVDRAAEHAAAPS